MGMNEQIKQLAEQIIGFEAKSSSLTFSPFELERFAELIRQDERERIKQENQRGYVFNPDGSYQGSGGGGRPQGEGRSE
jgi:hypothetical protein